MRKYNPELLYFSFDSFSRIQCKNVVFCSLVKMFNLLNIFHFITKNYKSLTKLKKSTSTSISPSLLSTTMHPYPLNHATHSPSKKSLQPSKSHSSSTYRTHTCPQAHISSADAALARSFARQRLRAIYIDERFMRRAASDARGTRSFARANHASSRSLMLITWARVMRDRGCLNMCTSGRFPPLFWG